VLLFLHVAGAITWVGLGLAVYWLLLWATRRDDPALVARLLSWLAWLDPRVTTGLLLLLGTGIWLVVDGSSRFSDPWIVVGLAGYAAALGWGWRVAEPELKRLAAVAQERGPDDPGIRAGACRLVALLRVDLAIFAVVVLAMTVKPATGTAWFWAAAGVILTAGGVLAAHAFREAGAGADQEATSAP
jgi:uncharacterized membrane protein